MTNPNILGYPIERIAFFFLMLSKLNNLLYKNIKRHKKVPLRCNLINYLTLMYLSLEMTLKTIIFVI